MATAPSNSTATFTKIRNKPKPAVQTLGPVRFQGLVDYLRQQISSEVLLPGDRLPSFVELQAQFGTSPGTVNRAMISLEHDGLVVRERRRGVFVADRNARIKQHAIGLAGFDTKTMHSSYWVQLIEGIQSVVHREDMELLLLRPNSTRGIERIDGVLWHGANDREMPGIARLITTVCLMDEVKGFSSVVADDFDGARRATEHLLKLGHRKVACLNYLRAPVNQQRLAGYRSALKAAGIAPQASWIQDMELPGGATLRAAGHLRMQQWLGGNWQKTGCTALLCQNDTVATGVIQALHEAGLRVPRHVSVVGYDGTEEGEQSTPRLTSVHIPLREIGMRAAELLFRQIHQERINAGVLTLPATLQVRDSTAPPPQIEI